MAAGDPLPARGDRRLRPHLRRPAPGGGFQGVWHLNRPAESWKLTVTTSGGAAVRTVTGGLARGKLTATWDGRAENGASGPYRYLPGETDRPRPRTARRRTRSLRQEGAGTVGGAPRLRPDGIGDLITFDSAGRVAVQPGTGRGTIDSAHKVLGGGWPTRRPSCRSATRAATVQRPPRPGLRRPADPVRRHLRLVVLTEDPAPPARHRFRRVQRADLPRRPDR